MTASQSTTIRRLEQEVSYLRHHYALKNDETEQLKRFILPFVAKASTADKVGYFAALGEQGQVDLARENPALFEEIERSVLPVQSQQWR